jgi:hypothetical protein
MEIKNYQYGGGQGPIENQKAIEDQFYARHQLRNALVELDRKTRSEFNALTNQENPSHDRILAINAEIESLRAEIMILRVPKAGDKSGKWRKVLGKGSPQGDHITNFSCHGPRPAPVVWGLSPRHRNCSGTFLPAGARVSHSHYTNRYE